MTAPTNRAEAIATVEETCAGPRLYIHGVKVRSWIGCMYDADAHKLAAEINEAADPATADLARKDALLAEAATKFETLLKAVDKPGNSIDMMLYGDSIQFLTKLREAGHGL